MAPLFHKRKIIYFVHIYKTGGTTINKLLYKNYKSEELIDLYIPYMSTGQSGEIFDIHDKLLLTKKTKIVYGHYAYGIHLKNPMQPYTYMCFVRNSIDRLISTYYHLKRMDIEWQFRILNKLDPGIMSQQDVWSKFPDLASYLQYDGLQNQQCMFLVGLTPDIIEKDQEYYAKMAIDNIDRDFSFVGMQEEFEESLIRLKKILKLKTTDYEYMNLGVNKPQEISYDVKIREIVNEKSRADKIIYEYIKNKFYS